MQFSERIGPAPLVNRDELAFFDEAYNRS